MIFRAQTKLIKANGRDTRWQHGTQPPAVGIPLK